MTAACRSETFRKIATLTQEQDDRESVYLILPRLSKLSSRFFFWPCGPSFATNEQLSGVNRLSTGFFEDSGSLSPIRNRFDNTARRGNI
jgi:hypothetical protein